MEQASGRTLGDEARMMDVANTMAENGHLAEAIAVRREIFRVGTPRGMNRFRRMNWTTWPGCYAGC